MRGSRRLRRVALAVAAGGLVLVGVQAAGAEEVEPGAAVATGTPTIDVEPSTGLADGQAVTVSGSGFTPNASVEVSMCDDPLVDGSSCDRLTAQVATTDAAGAMTMTYTVAGTVNGHTCVPTGCLIGASDPDAPGELADRVGLGFADGSSPPTTPTDGAPRPPVAPDAADPGAPADPAARGTASNATAQGTPTISVSPSTGLTDGQSVTVSGSGFTPNASIGVSMCDDPFVDGSSCDFSTAKIGTSSAAGAISMTFTVVDTINGHTCVPTGCLIGASNLNVQGEFANRVSLGFADGSSPSTTSTTDGSSPSTTAPDGSGGSDDGRSDGDDESSGDSGRKGTLPLTGASDSLPFLAVGGLVLVVAGVAVTRVAVRRSRAATAG